MRKRSIAVAIGALLCLGATAVAQDQPLTTQADKTVVEKQWGPSGQPPPTTVQTTLTGNVVIQVNGVVVRADRAVIRNGEITLEGNVRLTPPKPLYTAKAMRDGITPQVTPDRIETPKTDDLPDRQIRPTTP